MTEQVILGILGISSGIVVAGSAAAFIISLGIVPRYAGITRTAHRIRLYEDVAMLGAVAGNLCYLYHGRLPFGSPGLAVWGLFSGIFLGSWIIALGEVVNVFAIMARRLKIRQGIGWMICTMALGKTLGSLLFFQKGW